MMILTLLLVYFLVSVHGAAYPAPTAPPRLEKKQFDGATGLWTPVIVGTTVTYEQFGFSGSSTVSTSGSYFGWCALTVFDCLLATTCQQGTIFYPGTSAVCDATASVCGTEYLYSSLGGRNGFTRPACFIPSETNLNTFFLQSPPATSSTRPTTRTTPSPTTRNKTTSPTTPTTTTSSPTPTPTHTSSPTPVGAIVGGVVGGVAVIALAAIGIVWIIRRRPRQQTASYPEVVQQPTPQQPPPPGAGYDPSRASYVSSVPVSSNAPPTLYGNPESQPESFYKPPGASPTMSNFAKQSPGYAAPIPGAVEMNATSE